MKELRSILNLSWSNGVPADLVTPRANALTNGNRKNTNAVIPYRSVDSVVSLRNVAHSQEQHVVLFSFFFFRWSLYVVNAPLPNHATSSRLGHHTIQGPVSSCIGGRLMPQPILWFYSCGLAMTP